MKYKLKILNLKCYLRDESDGDEIYLISDGKKIWPADKKYLTITEEETPIGVDFDIEKGDNIPIDIWDHDKLSTNDHLGSLIIKADSHGQFVLDFTKTGQDGSRYGLEWEIG